MDQLELLHEIHVLMDGRYPYSVVPGAFVFGRADRDYQPTEGDSGILEVAAQLHREQLIRSVAVPGTKGGVNHAGEAAPETYPGPEVFRRQLEALGVPATDIHYTSPAPSHTRGDSDAFVEFAKQQGWATAVAIMLPHQRLRAMLGFLKSFAKHEHFMQILPVCPRTVNWGKPVYGSQGAEIMPRKKHTAGEWSRILKYQEDGHLTSFEGLHAYLSEMPCL